MTDGARAAGSGGRMMFEPRYAVTVALMFTLFWQTGVYLYNAWTLADSYYSHGFLVPFISLYFLWRDREAFTRTPRTPGEAGYGWMVCSAVALLFGDFLGFRVIGQLALVGMIVGLFFALQGERRTRVAWFPLAFLLFMVPIPASLTQSVALQLKLFATQCAVSLAHLVTLPVVREGSYVYFGADRLLIGDVCGGLRSLIALLAFGVLMAYLSKTNTWGRVAVLAMAGPIAVVANVVRIFLLCVVGYFWGSEVAGGLVHDVSGYLIFVLAFVLFFTLEALLRRWFPSSEQSEGAAPPHQSTPSQGAPGPRSASLAKAASRAFAITTGILVASTAAHLAVSYAQARAAERAPSADQLQIPDRIVDYERYGKEMEVNDRTRQVLETSTILIRDYRGPSGRPIQLTIVYAGATRRSLHFPEVCLTGEGYEVREQRAVNVSFLFSARRLWLVKGDRQEAALYWFKTGDDMTGNFFLNTLEWAKNQLTFGSPTSALIRLATAIGPSGPDDAFAALEDFAVKLAPILRTNVK